MAQSLKEWLDTLLKEKHLSLRALAKLSEVSESTLKHWRNDGTAKPHSWSQLLRVARMLGATRQQVNELLRLTHHPSLEDLLNSVQAKSAQAHSDPAKQQQVTKERALLRTWVTVDAAPSTHRPPMIPNNLRGMCCTQFIGRAAEVEDVLYGLRQRSPVVFVTSEPGIGKTCLVREVAARLMRGDKDGPSFERLIWINDAEHPGATTLERIFNTFVETLELSGKLEDSLDKNRRMIEAELRKFQTLLIVDNFETIRDPQVLPWLMKCPEPSKVIVTTQTLPSDIVLGWHTIVKPFNRDEARQFVDIRARALKVSMFVEAPADFEQLFALVGGNPKKLEMRLGGLKHGFHVRVDSPDTLSHATSTLQIEEILEDYWSQLDLPARHVLMAMALFPASATVRAVEAVSGVESAVFNRVMQTLTDLSLVDLQQAPAPIPLRRAVHPQVLIFATKRLAEHPQFETEARQHWMHWYIALVDQVGTCWGELGRLDLLDNEYSTALDVAQWAFDHAYYHEVARLASGVRYYFYVRGLWEKSLGMDLLDYESATHLNDAIGAVKALAHYLQVYCRKHGFDEEAARQRLRLKQLAQHVQLPPAVYGNYQQALALSAMAESEWSTAEQIWRTVLTQPDIRQQIAHKRWLALCLLRQKRWQEARSWLEESLHQAQHHSFQRIISLNQCSLGEIALEENDLDRAEQLLRASLLSARGHKAHEEVAQIQRLSGRLYARRGDFSKARTLLSEALELFEHAGMDHDVEQVKRDLQSLERTARKKGTTAGQAEKRA